MKGQAKRKLKGGFKKGHAVLYRPKPYQESREIRRKIRRLTAEQFSDAVGSDSKGVMSCKDQEGKRLYPTLLRPAPKDPSYWDSYNKMSTIGGNENTYMIVHRNKCAQMWNSEFQAHCQTQPSCNGFLDWDEQRFQKRGLCWVVAIKCLKCTYRSVTYKLYEEIQSESRGRKSAGPNIGVQVALARQGMSSSGLTELISSMNIISPATSGLQKSANKVNSELVKANQKDMENKLCYLQTLNECKGLSRQAPINIESDGTYNNRLSSGVGKTPMQPATQVTYLACENETPNKYIVHAGTYSKICGCKKSDSGTTMHTPNCGANLPQSAVIGNEGQYLQDTLHGLNKQGISVKFVTLDGDSNANAIVPNIIQPDDTELNSLRCTRHLTRTLETEVKKSKFSDTMFVGSNSQAKQQAHEQIFIRHWGPLYSRI